VPAPGRPSQSTQAGGSSSWLARRRARALKLRIDTARRQLAGTFPQRQTNGDEDAYPAGLANFTKTLPRNRLGEVDPDAYRRLLRALDSGRPADFDKVPWSARRNWPTPRPRSPSSWRAPIPGTWPSSRHRGLPLRPSPGR
jgi:hypothetical protein